MRTGYGAHSTAQLSAVLLLYHFIGCRCLAVCCKAEEKSPNRSGSDAMNYVRHSSRQYLHLVRIGSLDHASPSR